MKNKNKATSAMCVLTAIYAVLLVFVMFVVSRNDLPENDVPIPDYAKAHTNLIPFKTVGEYADRLQRDTINAATVVKNLFGNLILFAPIGIIYPFFGGKKMNFPKFLCAALGTVIAAEVLQLLLRCGSFDVDDIILNLLGAAIGFGAFAVCKKLLSTRVARTAKRN